MSSYFIMYWPCGKCICGAFVDEPKNSQALAVDAADLMRHIREGGRVSHQRGGSVTLTACHCTPPADGRPS